MTTKERIDEKRKHLRTGRAVLTALTTLTAVLALSLSGCAGTSSGSSAGKTQETATETSGESVSNKNASGKSVSTEGISTENRSGEEGSPAAAASEGPSAAEVAAEVSSADAATAGDLLKYLQGAACWMYWNCLQQPRGTSRNFCRELPAGCTGTARSNRKGQSAGSAGNCLDRIINDLMEKMNGDRDTIKL